MTIAWGGRIFDPVFPWLGVRASRTPPRRQKGRFVGPLRTTKIDKPELSAAPPARLTDPDEWLIWLTPPWDEARALQRPLEDGALELIEPSE